MVNGIDFVYEYSDLNLFKTRVKILTGEYADTILEYGGSILVQSNGNNTFTFEYELMQIPQHLANFQLKGNKEFEEFLAYLMVDVIGSRNNDPTEEFKLKQAASQQGVINSKIKIDPKFYYKQAVVI